MASKCWFVLKQTHYPPPVLPKSGVGSVKGSGPICLGHLIPDLKHLDNVINRHGPLDIPSDMPIYPTKAWDLTWGVDETTGFGVSGNAGVPIAAAAGLTLKLGAGVTFKKTIKNFWEFKSLETFIFQPTSEYVEDSIEDEEVVAYHEKRSFLNSSTVFMITGVIVARGAKTKTSDIRKQDIHGGPAVEIPTLVDVGFNINMEKDEEVSTNAHKTSDFVWAVRLAKISKGLIDRKWSLESVSSGATFGLDDGSDRSQLIIDSVKAEGFESIEIEKEVVDSEADDEVFMISVDRESLNSE